MHPLQRSYAWAVGQSANLRIAENGEREYGVGIRPLRGRPQQARRGGHTRTRWGGRTVRRVASPKTDSCLFVSFGFFLIREDSWKPFDR
jgi:hypothetical protein